MSTDKITTLLGFIESLAIFFHQMGMIPDSAFSFSSALIAFLFGYFTNKVRKGIKSVLPSKHNNSGIDL